MLTNHFSLLLYCKMYFLLNPPTSYQLWQMLKCSGVWHHISNYNCLQWIYNDVYIIKGWHHWGEIQLLGGGGYGRRHKQDALHFIQDVCYSVKWSVQIYVEDFPCPLCNTGAPLLHNYIVDTGDFEQTVDEICNSHRWYFVLFAFNPVTEWI